MKLGTHILFEDGREATVVFNGLCGVGIKWGWHDPDHKDFEGTSGDLFDNDSEGFKWEPDALLRAPWDGCEKSGFTKEQCIDDDYIVTRIGR